MISNRSKRRGSQWLLLATGATAVTLIFFVMTGAVAIGVSFGVLTALVWYVWQKQREAKARKLIREAWPDLVDDLQSSIRAGVSLPEAVTALGERAPVQLHSAFASFGARYRVTGQFDQALVQLDEQISDPVGARVLAALQLTNRVGGTDLGAVLRSLAEMLREDARLRGELEARQSWTVNAARLAVISPWLVLGLMSLRQAAVAAYRGVGGAIVLVVVLCLSAFAYYFMVKAAKLPDTTLTAT